MMFSSTRILIAHLLLMLMIVLLGLLTSAICLAQLLSYRRLRTHVEQGLRHRLTTYKPRVAVILPCKGLDHDFADNVRKLLEQEYGDGTDGGQANFEVVFAVASTDDPAYGELKKLSGNACPVKTTLVVAGIN